MNDIKRTHLSQEHEQSLTNPAFGYTASKLFAEQAAWSFLDTEKPSFTLATLAPPFVFGPVMHELTSIDALNTSNRIISGVVQGEWKCGIPPTLGFIWTDVRDLALGHVIAMEKPEAAGKRFFVATGHFTNKEMATIVKENFPEFNGRLPDISGQSSGFPEEGIYKVNNTQIMRILGIELTSFKKTIIDTVNSLKTLGIKDVV